MGEKKSQQTMFLLEYKQQTSSEVNGIEQVTANHVFHVRVQVTANVQGESRSQHRLRKKINQSKCD